MQIKWTRDEIILACDLVRQNNWQELRERDPRVVDLAALLRKSPQHRVEDRESNFRSTGSVSRKTTNIATQHPGYTGKKTRGNRLDHDVLVNFLVHPVEMAKIADQIRRGIERGEFLDLTFNDPDLEIEFEMPVGKLITKAYFRRERSRKLRQQKLDMVIRLGKRVVCEACGFDFGLTYGDRESGYIEVHHAVPLHVSGEVQTRLSDLVLLCANCHRIIHWKPPWLTVEQLKALIHRNKNPFDSMQDETSVNEQSWLLGGKRLKNI